MSDSTTTTDEEAETLQGIHFLLQHEDIKPIYKVLRATNSLYKDQLDKLTRICCQENDIAESNIQYLQLLMEPCAQIDSLENPAGLPTLLPRIIYLIRYIWLNSSTYSRNEDITLLFSDLSNQIIKFCTAKINLDKVLNGSTRFGIKMCNMSIDCCMSYKAIYEIIANQHNTETSSRSWDLKKETIFNHVDAFIQRLHNLIDICEAMIVFGRLDETDNIPKPIFGGTFGSEFDTIFDCVESRFMKQLELLKTKSKQAILNVYRNEWYEEEVRYRRFFKSLEESIDRLLSSVFQRICNIEESLEVLNMTFYFSYSTAMRNSYLRQVNAVWMEFQDEMSNVEKLLLMREKQHESWQSYHISQTVKYRICIERLEWMCNRLESSEWLPIVPATQSTLDKFTSLKKELNKASLSLFEDWVKKIGSEFQLHKLERHLIVKGKSLLTPLECNMDEDVLNACAEAKQFEQLGFTLPVVVRKLFDHHAEVNHNYNTVMKICKDYNTVTAELSERERKLFQNLIQILDQKISALALKSTWNDKLSEMHLTECMHQTEELHACAALFKHANIDMAKSCEEICDVLLFDFGLKTPLDLTECLLSVQSNCKLALDALTKLYNRLMELLTLIYDEFQSLIVEEAIGVWHSYVRHIDDMLAAALMTCGRNSLNRILQLVRSTTEVQLPPSPILFIEVDIKEHGVKLTPDLVCITNLFCGMFQRTLVCLQQFPRAAVQLHIPTQEPPFSELFANDTEAKQIRQSITCEMDYSQEELTKYLKFWQQYRNVWQRAESECIENILSLSSAHVAQAYEDRIQHYSDLADEIALMESTKVVHFFRINQNCMRNTLMNFIEKRQLNIINLLLARTTQQLQDIYAYMETNGQLIAVVPRNLKANQDAVALYERLVNEVSDKQNDFPQILELFRVLDKYRIDVPKETRHQVIDLDVNWQNYLKKLKEAEEILEMTHADAVLVNQKLVEETMRFKTTIKEVLAEFLTKTMSSA